MYDRPSPIIYYVEKVGHIFELIEEMRPCRVINDLNFDSNENVYICPYSARMGDEFHFSISKR